MTEIECIHCGREFEIDKWSDEIHAYAYEGSDGFTWVTITCPHCDGRQSEPC